MFPEREPSHGTPKRISKECDSEDLRDGCHVSVRPLCTKAQISCALGDRAMPTRADSDSQMSNAQHQGSGPLLVVVACGCLTRLMCLRSHAVIFSSNRQGGKRVTFNAKQGDK